MTMPRVTTNTARPKGLNPNLNPSPYRITDTSASAAADDEPAIIDEKEMAVAKVKDNPSLEADTSNTNPFASGVVGGISTSATVSVEGWKEFDPRCSECVQIMTGKRADRCPECGVILHPYCYHQHYMRNHLPKAIPLVIHVQPTLLDDGTWGNYKGYISPYSQNT